MHALYGKQRDVWSTDIADAQGTNGKGAMMREAQTAGVWALEARGKGNERVLDAHVSSAPDGLDPRCLSPSPSLPALSLPL